MGITLDEEMLSPQARDYLRNTRNKSKLLRELLETHVRSVKGEIVQTATAGPSNISDPEMKQDIKDIKNLLLELKSQGIQAVVPENLVAAVNEGVKPVVSVEVKETKIVNEPAKEIKTVEEVKPVIVESKVVKEETQPELQQEPKITGTESTIRNDTNDVENMLKKSIMQFAIEDDEE